MATLPGQIAQVVPYLQGVGAVATVATSIFHIISGVQSSAAEEHARQAMEQFHRELLQYLQGFQASLDRVSDQLDHISKQLKGIDADIRATEVDPALNAIQTWGEALAMLDADDSAGLQKLASDMMNTQDPNKSIEGYMNLIHNHIVGDIAGQPILNVVGMDGYLLLRARIVQGLHLLIFGCVYNRKQHFDADRFTAEWARKMEHQNRAALNHDNFVGTFEPGSVPLAPGVRDAIFISQVMQPSVPNVTLLATRNGVTIPLYTGTLVHVGSDDRRYWLGFAEAEQFKFVVVDWNRKQLDPGTWSLGDILDASKRAGRALAVVPASMTVLGDRNDQLHFQSSLRQPESGKIFLGAYPGQIFSLTRDRNLVASIHAGTSDRAPLLVLKGDSRELRKRSLSTVSLESLEKMSSALWRILYVDDSHVIIAYFQWDLWRDSEKPPEGDPSSGPKEMLFLTLDDEGSWVTTMDVGEAVLEVAVADTEVVSLSEPAYSLKPTPILVSRQLNKAPLKTILLRKL